MFFDLYVVNTTEYVAGTPENNKIIRGIAQISFKANTRTGLRVYVRPSCATADSCSFCDDALLNPTAAERTACYAAGCGCYAATCYEESCCSGFAKMLKKQQYTVPMGESGVPFPAGSTGTMSVFGLDSGVNGQYVEEMIITSGFTYFKTPLRPASGNNIASAVIVDEAAGTFTSSTPSTTGQPHQCLCADG